MPESLAVRLDAGLAALRQDLSADARRGLLDYLALLARWNRAYNLSAVRDPMEMIARHLLDSLAVRPHLPAGALLDLGSGAGLPGLVLALVEPQRPVTLLDSNGKKTRFLEHAVLQLRLSNIQVVRARAETWDGGAGYAAVTARAYADLDVFWRHPEPRLGPGGQALALKGRRPEAELAALADEGVSCSVARLSVPGLSAERHLVTLARSG